ncbi:caspase-3-like [Mytilus californianus]|uniref:caspase-3-like n=1 Tax=Mytilus californianus TaxID=6549 RepID=UPI0022480255|nr:caspase-3-like [Mytilus californianus]
MADKVNGVKVTLAIKEHRMLQISRTEQSLDSLKNDIRRKFPLLNQPNVFLKLFWKDEYGDKISMATNSDLIQALNLTDGKLQLEIEVDNIAERELSQKAAEKTQAELEAQYSARYPPLASLVETTSRSISHQDSASSGVHESIPRQTSSASEPPRDRSDVLDIPVDHNTLLLDGWPSSETYSLNMIKKGKKYLDENFLSNRTYDTDPGKQCRVLCILNKQSRDKALYQGNGIDVECTWLQQMKKQFKWDLQIHKDKTSAEICDILENERNRDFSVNHSLFVIIISRGDQYGMYGTNGERIEYWGITTRFDEVSDLKGKPKIFILDDCEIGSDIHDEVYSRGVQEETPTNPKQLIRTVSGREVLADQRDSVALPNKKLDTYICKASTLGRNDSVVKGSWVIGALMSVMCKAANNMTFKQMMIQVQLMIQDAIIPDGKPDPDMIITDDLTKDFYLLPPPC